MYLHPSLVPSFPVRATAAESVFGKDLSTGVGPVERRFKEPLRAAVCVDHVLHSSTWETGMGFITSK